MTCPRVATKERIIELLKAGNTLYVDRRDAPELEDLRALVAEGLVEFREEDLEPQYSRIAFRWKRH